MLTKLTITRGFIDSRKGIEEDQELPYEPSGSPEVDADLPALDAVQDDAMFHEKLVPHPTSHVSAHIDWHQKAIPVHQKALKTALDLYDKHSKIDHPASQQLATDALNSAHVNGKAIKRSVSFLGQHGIKYGVPASGNKESEEALAPEIIGTGSSQRNIGPGGRRTEKRNTSHFARQQERGAARRIMQDPEAAKDPGFDPDLPPKRATGWAD